MMNPITALFGGMKNTAPTSAPAAPAPTPTSQLSQNPGTVAPQNGSVPATPPNEGSSGTPNVDFSKLWDTPANAGDANKPLFANIDPAKIQEAAGKIDFAKVVSAETLAKIQAGGPEASAAFIDALNRTAQTVYGQSAVATTQIVDRAVQEAVARMEQNLPNHIKKQTASDALKSQNKLLANPAIAPIIGAVQGQLMGQFPNASPEEINQMTMQYVQQFADTMAPKKAASSGNKNPKDDAFDWDAFANS